MAARTSEEQRKDAGLSAVMFQVAAEIAAKCATGIEAAVLLEREALRLSEIAGYPRRGNKFAGDAEFNSWQDAA